MSLDILIMPADCKMKLHIAHSVDAPIDELSVSEICEKADVSRQTFYKHFESKYEISRWFAGLSEERFLDEIGRTLSWYEGLSKHFTLLATEKLLFLRSSHNRWQTSTMEKVRRHRIEVLTLTLHEYRNIEPDEDLGFCLRAYTHMEENMAMEWFAAGMKPSAERFAALLDSCVPAPLHAALDLELQP